MKIIIFTRLSFILLIITPLILLAQAPEKIDFQAVARETSGEPIANQNISVLITIQEGLPGDEVYIEKHLVQTDNYGLFSLAIGAGNDTIFGSLYGSFAEIDWSNGVYFTKVEIDRDNGDNYTNMGTMEIMSVPYALHAKNTDSWSVNDDTTYTMKNVGIGTSSPGTILHILADDPDISLDIPSTSSFSNAELRFRKDGETKSRIYFNKNDSVLYFENNGANSIILNNQNVGIGTGSPRGRLDINGGSDPEDALYVKSSGSIADQGGIIHYQNSIHPYAWQEVTKFNNSEGGMLSFHFINNFDPSQKINPNVLVLRNGRVGIGTNNPSSKLTVVGITGTSNSYPNLLYSSGSGAIFFQSDSRKHLKIIGDYRKDFSSLLQVDPKEYLDKSNNQLNIGFIAEEFDELGLTDLVIYNGKNEPEAIKYDRISVYLVEIIKNQQKRIEELEKKMGEIEKSK